jgi:hypothetical protein
MAALATSSEGATLATPPPEKKELQVASIITSSPFKGAGDLVVAGGNLNIHSSSCGMS